MHGTEPLTPHTQTALLGTQSMGAESAPQATTASATHEAYAVKEIESRWESECRGHRWNPAAVSTLLAEIQAGIPPGRYAGLDTRMPPWILTRSGHQFDYLDPAGSDFGIADIAHGLSNLCRFSGQATSFYSVAQHSLYVSLILPDDLALAGLLHDAAEAFIGDMPTPLKNMLPGYLAIEREVERAVFARFGLPDRLPQAVKVADRILLATERRDLMPYTHHPWHVLDGITPLSMTIQPIPPEHARRAFLERYEELAGTRTG